MPRPSAQRRAFSLAELLIVIGIIAALVALL
jgi:prepilin-type N-terminal cleavage/methylation domain-containing protein